MLLSKISILLLLAHFSCFNAKLRLEFNPTKDKIHLEELQSINKASKNVENSFFSTLAIGFLGGPTPECKKGLLKPTSVDHEMLLETYNKRFCNQDNKANQRIKQVLDYPSNLRDLHYAVVAAKEFKQQFKPDTIFTTLLNLHEPTSPISNGYAYLIAVELGIEKTKLSEMHATVRNTIAAAIDYNGEILFYENGAVNTAIILQGIMNLEKYLSKPSSLANEQGMKFANFFFSQRQSMAEPKAWFLSMSALKQLLETVKSTPLILFNAQQQEKNTQPLRMSKPNDKLSLGYTAIWPQLKDSKVKVDFKVVGILDKVNKKPLFEGSDFGTCKSAKIGQCELAIEGVKLPPGAYDLLLSLVKPDASIFVNKIFVPLIVRDDSPATSVKSYTVSAGTQKPIQISVGQKASGPIKLMDEEELKIIVSFSNDEAAKQIKQCHFRFDSQFESLPYALTYVASTDCSLNLAASKLLKDGLGLGGSFQVTAVIGSAKPLKEVLFELQIVGTARAPSKTDFIKRARLPAHDLSDYEQWEKVKLDSGAESALSTRPFWKGELSNQKVPLQHTFREPEKRASPYLAMVFTAVCLSPLAILILGWPIVGFNLSDLPCSLAVPVYHLGLLAIFSIYGLYWLRLDMFTALKFLTLVGVPTFLAGNSLLRTMVARRSQQ